MKNNWHQIAAVLMFLGVALGAFAAHALKDKFTPYAMEIFKTAVFYHFVHALGLFFIGWLLYVTGNPKANLAGGFILAGIILFSGSLYALALTDIKILGAITPLGGLSFLIGWLIVVFISFNK